MRILWRYSGNPRARECSPVPSGATLPRFFRTNQRVEEETRERRDQETGGIGRECAWRSSIGFQGYTIVRVAWRRGEERANGFEPGLVIPTSRRYVYVYRVSFEQNAKGSGTEEKGMRRDELVSFGDLAWCRSSQTTDRASHWFRPATILGKGLAILRSVRPA